MTLLRSAAVGFLAALSVATAHADPDPKNIDTRPSLVKPEARDPRSAESIQDTIDQLKKLSDQIKTVTEGKLDLNSPYDLGGLKNWGLKNPDLDVAGVLKTALDLMEAYGYIDPRENLLQPDYSPRGLPALPSRAVGDSTLDAEDYGTFIGLQRDINHAKEFLEHNYVILKQTEIKTKRLSDLASSAASMSGIAGLYWAKVQGDPNDPMNKSKAGFYAKYDAGQESGLKFLDTTLKRFADFEYRKYGDRNWYLYFGLPYYNFMVTRYTRA
jgi:hypothetical protein